MTSMAGLAQKQAAHTPNGTYIETGPRVSVDHDEKPEVFATLATAAVEEGQPVAPPSGIGPPPDGGLKAWLTVLGSFFAVFTQFGMG